MTAPRQQATPGLGQHRPQPLSTVSRIRSGTLVHPFRCRHSCHDRVDDEPRVEKMHRELLGEQGLPSVADSTVPRPVMAEGHGPHQVGNQLSEFGTRERVQSNASGVDLSAQLGEQAARSLTQIGLADGRHRDELGEAVCAHQVCEERQKLASSAQCRSSITRTIGDHRREESRDRFEEHPLLAVRLRSRWHRQGVDPLRQLRHEAGQFPFPPRTDANSRVTQLTRKIRMISMNGR